VNSPLSLGRFTPAKEQLHPLNRLLYGPQPMWTISENRKSLDPDRSARSLVTIPTELPRRSICSVVTRMRSGSLDFIDSFLLLNLALPAGMVLSGRRKCVYWQLYFVPLGDRRHLIVCNPNIALLICLCMSGHSSKFLLCIRSSPSLISLPYVLVGRVRSAGFRTRFIVAFKYDKLIIFERKFMRKIFGPIRTDYGYWSIKLFKKWIVY